MEALTAAAVAALTIYDMAKAIDKGMVIAGVQLVEKTKEPSGEGSRAHRLGRGHRMATREDRSGDLLAELLAARGHEVERRVVPDERGHRSPRRSASSPPRPQLVLTTGGTGLAPRDVTPEATLDVVERVAPGIAEAIRADSIAKTPHGLLSRGVAGVRRAHARGQPARLAGGCRDGYAVLRPALGHAVELLAGEGRAATDRRRPARRHATGRARLPPLRSRERLGRCVARWMQLEGSRGGRAGCARWPSLPASCSARVHASAATCSIGRGDSFTGSVQCRGNTARLEFDPGRIEVSVRGLGVIEARAGRREFDYGVCARAATQSGWFVGVPYHRTAEAGTVTCRFPGGFSVHTHPVSPSWAGERPAGSAVYLVLNRRAKAGPGPKRTIVASASVVERPEESGLSVLTLVLHARIALPGKFRGTPHQGQWKGILLGSPASIEYWARGNRGRPDRCPSAWRGWSSSSTRSSRCRSPTSGAALALGGDPLGADLLWITVAMVGARSLAMGLNRLIDAGIDARNPRTAGRELPSGALSVAQVFGFCVRRSLVFLVAVWQLDPLVRWLWPIPVAGFVIYPYLKRYTWLAHLWLGAVDGLAAVGGWVAVTGELPLESWLLGAAVGAVDRRLRSLLLALRRGDRPRPGAALVGCALG